jgi:hypothetical protein
MYPSSVLHPRYPPHGIIQTAEGREYEQRMTERDFRKPSSWAGKDLAV